jgi:arylsulfatase A-like enzyme/Tfp pilus assembly protein PilF
MLFSAAAAFSAWKFVSTRGGFELSKDENQNVLLVTIDTLRADALSAYGGKANTPNIDRLAAHGARFDNAHSQAVVTLVSHTSILTGLYPYQTGVRENQGYRVSPDTPTLATRLKSKGFDTAAFIAGFPLTKRFGLTSGFDRYDDRIAEERGAIDFSLPERRADTVVSSALNWIEERHGKKFFAWVHVFDPHAPYKPPEQWQAQYASNPYLGEVAWTDSALGALFDRLSSLPQKTLVIITGDHGEGLGDHGEMTHGFFAYESTLHVPLIISEVDPKATSYPKPRVITTPTRHIDIVPTVLDAIGESADPTLSGSSLRPEIINPTFITPTIPDRPSYFEAMTGFLTRGWAPLRGVIAGGDKYIDLPVRELYHLKSDPAEQRNQASSDTSRVKVMIGTLSTFDTNLPGAPKAESAQVSAELRSLGYASPNGASHKTVFSEKDDPKRLIELDHDLHVANEFYSTGRIPEAIQTFERVIAKRPDLVDAYRYMAYVYWQAGQPAAAIKTLEATFTLGIADQDIRTRLGTFLAETGQPGKAITVLASAPVDDVEAMNALGIAYGQAGKNAEALRTFEAALKVDPTNGIAFQNIGTIKLRENKIAEAEVWVKKALNADPSLANAYTTIGVIFQRTGRGSNAIEAWRRAVELDGTEFDALFNLTISLVQSGQLDEARHYGDQFLATAPPAFYGADLAEIRRLIGR